ncbi:MAG: hypothetical protein R6U13_05475 [Desulfatiglandaceae bacterium]
MFKIQYRFALDLIFAGIISFPIAEIFYQLFSGKIPLSGVQNSYIFGYTLEKMSSQNIPNDISPPRGEAPGNYPKQTRGRGNGSKSQHLFFASNWEKIS